MSKLTYDDKINIYKERKNGVGAITLSKKYGVRRDKIYYLENLIDSEYEDIIWFPMGRYLITNFSQSQDLTKISIKITGKDKMCKLNGELGGSFTSLTTNLSLDANNNKVKIIDIITNLLSFYGDEPLHNIVINDIEENGFELLEYRGDTPLYLLEQVDGDKKIVSIINNPYTTNCYLNNKLITMADSSIIYKKLNLKTDISDSFNETDYSAIQLEQDSS
jgi:hypothetical protein